MMEDAIEFSHVDVGVCESGEKFAEPLHTNGSKRISHRPSRRPHLEHAVSTWFVRLSHRARDAVLQRAYFRGELSEQNIG
jgi:hypothetical protein